MFLIGKDRVHDIDLRLLSDLVAVIDKQLELVEEQAQGRWEDADMSGEFDWAEHVAGLGFTSCQTYLAATYPFTRITKPEALNLGPIESKSKRPVVSVINAAANFWKHNPEWSLQPEARRVTIIKEAFDDVGYPVDCDYPLTGILAELTGGAIRFRAIIPLLDEWRDALINEEAQQAAHSDAEPPP